VAYFVGVDHSQISTSELRRHLLERLPEYMAPTAYMQLAAMPLMPNGKIDRNALPPPSLNAQQEGAVILPRTPLEELLAGIWMTVLGGGEVSVTANFFELGGHSLLATQVMSRIKEALGVELSVRSLFGAPTVRGLAEVVEQEMGRTHGI